MIHPLFVTKAANPIQQQLQQQLADQLRQQALRTALGLGLTTFGLGMGARGLMGLGHVSYRNLAKPRKPLPGATPVEIPVEEVEKTARLFTLEEVRAKGAAELQRLKAAGHGRRVYKCGHVDSCRCKASSHPALEQHLDEDCYSCKEAASKQAGILDALGQQMGKAVDWGAEQAGHAGQALQQLGKGDYARSEMGVPWAQPLMAASGVGGLAAGYGITDWLLDRRRKQQLKAELQQAQQEYQQALLKQGELGEELDALYDEVKSASALTPGELSGRVLGGYLAAALLAGGFAGYKGYQYGAKTQKKTLLDKALKLRQRQLYAQQPSPVFAVPVPAPKPPSPPAAPALKAASITGGLQQAGSGAKQMVQGAGQTLGGFTRSAAAPLVTRGQQPQLTQQLGQGMNMMQQGLGAFRGGMHQGLKGMAGMARAPFAARQTTSLPMIKAPGQQSNAGAGAASSAGSIDPVSP